MDAVVSYDTKVTSDVYCALHFIKHSARGKLAWVCKSVSVQVADKGLIAVFILYYLEASFLWLNLLCNAGILTEHFRIIRSLIVSDN